MNPTVVPMFAYGKVDHESLWQGREFYLHNSNNNDDNNNDIEKCNWNFFLQSPHCTTNCLQHICSSGQAHLCANQVQHIMH